MKKTVRTLVVMVMVIAIFAMVTVPAMAAGFDFETAIAAFQPTPLNTISLKEGQTHTPTAALWAQSGAATCYSSDETVVTVSKEGTVTAVGEGTAYVAIDTGAMYELYCYNVSAKAGVGNNTTGNENADDTNDTANNENAGDTNDSADKENGVHKDNSDEAEKNQDKHENKTDKLKDKADRWQEEMRRDHAKRRMKFALIFIPIFSLAMYSIVSILCLSAKSMKKKVLPPVQTTKNTITQASGERNTFVVPINGKMTAKKFEKTVNQWLAENPYVYNCKIKLDIKTSLLSPFVAYKFFVKYAAIEYSVADHPVNSQYALAFIYKFRPLGPIGYSKEKHVAGWLANNNDCSVISTCGGRIQHFGSHGFYAQYYNYVFFKK